MWLIGRWSLSLIGWNSSFPSSYGVRAKGYNSSVCNTILSMSIYLFIIDVYVLNRILSLSFFLHSSLPCSTIGMSDSGLSVSFYLFLSMYLSTPLVELSPVFVDGFSTWHYCILWNMSEQHLSCFHVLHVCIWRVLYIYWTRHFLRSQSLPF